jgi:hypothetical protein
MVAVSAFAEPDGNTANPVMDRRVARRRPAFFRRHPGGTRAAAGVIAALAQAQDVGDQRIALLGAEREVGHEHVTYGEVAVERPCRRARENSIVWRRSSAVRRPYDGWFGTDYL